jgi:hypothetical protein
MLKRVQHYNTDIGNWKEPGTINLKGTIPYPLTIGLDQIVLTASRMRAAVIIRTTYQSPQKPGSWYIKGTSTRHNPALNIWMQTDNRQVTHSELQAVCERNQERGWKSCRDCYLLEYE